MKWKASLFGPFRLVGPDGRIFQTKSKRSKAMLAFLASTPSLCADRHALARSLFNPDDLPGGPNLSLLLTRTHSSLAAHSELTLVVATNEGVSLLADNFECDLSDFEALLERAAAETDPLAAGVALRDALAIADQSPFGDIDHPMLDPIREQIAGRVLEALVSFARGPLGAQHSTMILERLNEFDIRRPCDALRAEQLMRLFAGLGMKEEVVSTFSSYESHLDYECGERVPGAFVDLFDSLLASMDQPKVHHCGAAPEQPRSTVGRQESLADLVRTLEAFDGRNRLITLTGQSGIGKSHLLHALYWQIFPQWSVAHFDLELQPAELVGKILNDRPCQVVLIDHVREAHCALVGQLVRTYPDTRFVCASHSRLGLPDEYLMTLGPLELGEASRPGPAIELLERNLQLVHDTGDSASSTAPDPLLFELASLCDGIPLALEIAGRLSGSIGLRATIRGLRRDVDALTSDRRDRNRRSSLRNAIESSYQNLGSEAQRLVAFLAGLGARCHIDHLLECSEGLPCDLEEGILSGLVVRGATGSYVRVLRSTAASLQAATASQSQDEGMARFRVKSTEWFKERAEEKPLDLGIADSLPLALEMVNRMIGAEACDEAIGLFASIRPWLGSSELEMSLLEGIDGLLMGDAAKSGGWPSAVLTLSAAYFHAGEFERMRETVTKAIRVLEGTSVSGDLRCQLTMQLGLAERALGNFEEAISGYRQALVVADASVDDSTLVKCHYNLGTLLEAQERLVEALQSQESASRHFTGGTDPRVESLVNTCIGRLRYRLGSDLDSAGLILEATLAHARDRQDMRSVGEILQNLGQIYWERRAFAKAAIAETTGSCLLLDFGYNEEFRRLAKSSFVTLCACLFELGLDALAHASRTMVDRLGPAELYAPNQILLESLAGKTYAQPPNLRLAPAGEAEVRRHLLDCLEHLELLNPALGGHHDLVRLVRGVGEAPAVRAANGVLAG